jgi:hypothetical protein
MSPSRRGAVFPVDIIDAKIVRFGAPVPSCDIEGGGLIIDYIPEGQANEKRLVLAFNECGMWVEAER